MPNRKNKTGRARQPTQPSNTIHFYAPHEKPYGIFCPTYPTRLTLPTASLAFLLTTSPFPSEASAVLNAHDNDNDEDTPTLRFTSANHLTTFSKALYFGDVPTSHRILSTTDATRHEELGQQVRDFDEQQWSRVEFRVHCVANWYKFCGNQGFMDTLLGTGEKDIAEANAWDKVWGKGFRAMDEDERKRVWGESSVGRAIVRVRGRLRDVLGREERGEDVRWEWNGCEEGDGVEGETRINGEKEINGEKRKVGEGERVEGVNGEVNGVDEEKGEGTLSEVAVEGDGSES